MSKGVIITLGILGALAFAGSKASAQSTPSLTAINEEKKKKFWRIIGQWESAQDYGAVKATAGELSYGFLQANYQAGMLRLLLNQYKALGGQYADALLGYLNRGGQLYRDQGFINMLKQAANDKTMQLAQLQFFHSVFLDKAYQKASSLGWVLPISYLALADAFINSGETNAVKQLAQWAVGENEQARVQSFLANRKEWLRTITDGDSDLLNRMDFYIRLLAEDPQVNSPVTVRNTVVS